MVQQLLCPPIHTNSSWLFDIYLCIYLATLYFFDYYLGIPSSMHPYPTRSSAPPHPRLAASPSASWLNSHTVHKHMLFYISKYLSNTLRFDASPPPRLAASSSASWLSCPPSCLSCSPTTCAASSPTPATRRWRWTSCTPWSSSSEPSVWSTRWRHFLSKPF